MTVTRRLFARMLPAAPAAAALSAEGMMARVTVPLNDIKVGNIAGYSPTDSENGAWDRFRKVFWPQERAIFRREKYLDLTGGYSPDIMSLRSVSPQFKARMLAADAIARRDAVLSLENLVRRQFGLREQD